MRKEIKRSHNPIIAYEKRLESYFGANNVWSPIIDKPNDWSPIIAIFSLPPALVCIPGPRGFPEFVASAFGRKIFFMHPVTDDDGYDIGVPTIDVQDRTFNLELQPNMAVLPIYIPVGDDRLFALDMYKLEILQKPESGQPWMWERLARPPFLREEVSSYCVQPNGCILFSTVMGITFIYDTKEYVWKEYGQWVLPFSGRGHYDASLEGFVGLSKDAETLGCLTVTGLDSGEVLHPTSPNFKCTKEKVYSNDTNEGQHVSATLVHMRLGTFCLVECVSIGNKMTVEELQQELRSSVPPGYDMADFMGGGPQGGRCMYRLKTFTLCYDTKGDLKLINSEVFCYSLPHEAKIGSIYQDPVAFWL